MKWSSTGIRFEGIFGQQQLAETMRSFTVSFRYFVMLAAHSCSRSLWVLRQFILRNFDIFNFLIEQKMATASDTKRQLQIKTGVLKRLAKEKVMYDKEVEQQSAKVEKMKEENKDEYDIKKQIEVLDESKIMIPDCKRRIKAAYKDLETLVASTEADFADTEQHKNAKEILEKTVLED